MDLWTAMNTRRSVRAFQPTEVSPDAVTRLLEAAIRAPSAGNRQPWHFIVVRRKEVRQRLAEAAHGQDFVAQAPVVIVICAEPERSATRYGTRGKEVYCLQDTAAATEHILLAATALGLGTCWVGAFDEDAAAQALGLPARLRPVAMLPVGQTMGELSAASARRPLSEVVSFLD